MPDPADKSVCLFWFRRDLRLDDNAGLFHALTSGLPVLPVFIFDTDILNQLKATDARVTYIYGQIELLKKRLEQHGSSLVVRYGMPLDVFSQLTQQYSVKAVFINRDYEPYARQRDRAVEEMLLYKGIAFHAAKDQVIFDQDEVLKDDGLPYTVFSPYSVKWKKRLALYPIDNFPSEKHLPNLLKTECLPMLSLQSLGFSGTVISVPDINISEEMLHQYGALRDFPAQQGTSRLSVALRFGTVSIREVSRKALLHSEVFLNELIWRNFYMDILYHFPHVETRSFKPAYDFIPWRNDEKDFVRWCEGQTGFPLVDAGMRELNETGFMHNRLRMVVASFLTKHLLIDWRWGEAYFAEKLMDFDLAANNGGWQWASGSGCDAAPYFRVFNPEAQTQKFDPQLAYIRKWVPEFDSFSYPRPIVDHAFARNRALETYKKGLEPQK